MGVCKSEESEFYEIEETTASGVICCRGNSGYVCDDFNCVRTRGGTVKFNQCVGIEFGNSFIKHRKYTCQFQQRIKRRESACQFQQHFKLGKQARVKQ